MYEVPPLSPTVFFSFLAFAFRFGSVAQLIGISFGLSKAGAPRHTRKSWVAYVVTASCYLVGPVLIRYLPWTLTPVVLGAFASPFFFWMFIRCFFDDRFRPGIEHLVFIVAFELTSYLSYPGNLLLDPRTLRAVPLLGAMPLALSHVLAILLNITIVVQAWLTRNADLLEARRRAALRFVTLYSVLIFFILAAEIFSPGNRVPVSVDFTIQSACFVFLVFLNRHVILQGALWFRVAPAKRVAPRFDEAFRERFEHLMAVERVYLQPDLNVRNLSGLLGTPEYLVRKYINEQLGFRNFHDFLNAARMERARHILATPEGREAAITSLAFDLGYQSLATFNRVFRQYCGRSPSEFRRGGL